MAHGLKITNAAASAGVDAQTALVDGGVVRLYDGTKPADADTAPTAAEHVLSEHTLSATAFLPAEDGVAAADAIADDTDAAATGNASWARFVAADTTTGVWDCTVGPITDPQTVPWDILMPTVAIQEHAKVEFPSFTYTGSKG